MAQRPAPRQAAVRSDTHEPRPHAANALSTPTSDPLPSTSQTTNTHAQSIAVHTQQCAHKPQARALHMRTGCSRTRHNV
eukprot:3819813-Prymnesium_polylepis.1